LNENVESLNNNFDKIQKSISRNIHEIHAIDERLYELKLTEEERIMNLMELTINLDHMKSDFAHYHLSRIKVSNSQNFAKYKNHKSYQCNDGIYTAIYTDEDLVIDENCLVTRIGNEITANLTFKLNKIAHIKGDKLHICKLQGEYSALCNAGLNALTQLDDSFELKVVNDIVNLKRFLNFFNNGSVSTILEMEPLEMIKRVQEFKESTLSKDINSTFQWLKNAWKIILFSVFGIVAFLLISFVGYWLIRMRISRRGIYKRSKREKMETIETRLKFLESPSKSNY